MDCQVVVEAAIQVYNVDTTDEAIRIAIAKTGEMLNPELNYVEIDPSTHTSPGGKPLSPAFVAAGDALVALELEMTIFNVEEEVHASRIALAEIGQQLDGVSLTIHEVEVLANETSTQASNEDDADRQQ